jgi:hypothetical protein
MVIDALLVTGERDAIISGGCRWDPVQLSEDEFDAVVAELTLRPSDNGELLRYDPPPSRVTTQDEWNLWVAVRLHSVPDAENRRLSYGQAARLTESSAQTESRTSVRLFDSRLSAEYRTRQASGGTREPATRYSLMPIVVFRSAGTTHARHTNGESGRGPPNHCGHPGGLCADRESTGAEHETP